MNTIVIDKEIDLQTFEEIPNPKSKHFKYPITFVSYDALKSHIDFFSDLRLDKDFGGYPWFLFPKEDIQTGDYAEILEWLSKYKDSSFEFRYIGDRNITSYWLITVYQQE